MNLEVIDGGYNIVKLSPNDEIPANIFKEEIYSITRTNEELSIVVKNDFDIKSDIVENNWKMIKIVGTLDFSLIGILSKISTILANAKVSIFAMSTYNTNYILVKESDLDKAINVLKENNYIFNN